ncbi:Na/Pi cotransporter family protein [Cytobacillus purgationiresistens]|uniref:Phosphate:Na+ symporter n=1 Tax=Cytobacillus purgationiresistens TaxID=863449 RepID=A0ABU0ADY5_9BACI|nr:Na/Pi cotransporter family protein [Cytobacillus purgationiresistens]MDQ0269461.1 phosphate:Na+ symporter [Cytobacillus purgationiresistens]
MELNVQQIIFEFIGGLGIFLYGIKTMGEGLQRSAGDRLRDILDRFTTNPFMGVLAGILVTVLIQSSTATTVITVGLVSAGFMTLRQAIGVIMGANIGTTFTAFIIGLNVGEYALPMIAVGVVLLIFVKNAKVNNIGSIVFGLGALFFGLGLMTGAMKPLSGLQSFHDLTLSMSDNPILGLVVGTVLTVVVQSSTATIGILQGLYAGGLVDLNAALPILFGDNVGTTITAVLAAIGASVAAKRAAAVHVVFNVIGATIFLILLKPFTFVISYLEQSLALNPEMTVAFAHGIYNVSNTIIQFPFIAVLAWIVTKLVPGEDSIKDYKAKHLDPMFIQQSPSIALGQAKEEVLRMGQFALDGLEDTNKFLKTGDQKYSENAYQLEDAINGLDRNITEYLISLSRSSLSNHESEEHTVLMDTIRDIERIGDHFENIIELMDYKKANKVSITESAMDDLDEMFKLTISTVKEALESLDHGDKEAAIHVVQKEEQIDKMERKLRKQHILRLSEGVCSGQAGIVYVDILSNLERIGDHAVNIAEAVLGEE